MGIDIKGAISNAVNAVKSAAVGKAQQVASDVKLGGRINNVRIELAMVNAKLDKLGWSASAKPERQQLTLQKQVLTQELTGLQAQAQARRDEDLAAKKELLSKFR